MTAEIILRKDALAIGRVRYFTGKPCKHGHIAERLSCDATCIECSKESRNRRYAQDPEKFREFWRKRRRYRNLEKSNAARRRLRALDPEKFREQDRRRRVKNPEKRLDANRKWREKNPDKVLAANRRWAAKNPGKRRIYVQRRRALKLNAGGYHTVEQITDLFKKQKGKCAGCLCSIKRGWENDHIIALSKGGSNDISNIQLLCGPCNRKKHDKDPIVWAQKNGRLL